MSSSAGDGAGEPAIGQMFAGHRIEAVLGRGGMGVVYRARNLALDRPRALKVIAAALSADQRFRDRFRRESRLAAKIEHPNVIPVHEAGEEGGQLYLSMRLVEGTDLRELVKALGPLDQLRALEVVGAAGAALDAAHGAGLIHRDVKPANILVGSGADAGRVFLTDFGISRTAGGGETVTRTGEIVGTADFLAPEQIAGDPVDHRADLYALGAVAHYALTGEPPFPRDSELATLFAHANAPRPRPSESRPHLPAALDAVVGRALAVEPGERFASGRELAAAFAAALGGKATVALASEPPPRTAPVAQRSRPGRPWAAIAAGLAALAAALVTAIALIGDEDGGAPEREQSTPAGEDGLRASDPIAVGAAPAGITVGDERTWVAARDGDQVDGINQITSSNELSIDVPDPVAVAVGHGSVWAISDRADALFRLDPLEGTTPTRVLLPGGSPSDIAVDDRWVWVSDETGTVLRFDPAAPLDRPVTEQLVPGVRAIATGLDSVWIVNVETSTLDRLDAETGRRTRRPVDLGPGRPSDVAVGEGAVWVIDNYNGNLIEVDPEKMEVVDEAIPVGDLPRGVKAGFGSVWVALGGEDSVVRIDPETRSPIGEAIHVGQNPADVALGGDSAWTANQDDSTVSRIRVEP